MIHIHDNNHEFLLISNVMHYDWKNNEDFIISHACKKSDKLKTVFLIFINVNMYDWDISNVIHSWIIIENWWKSMNLSYSNWFNPKTSMHFILIKIGPLPIIVYLCDMFKTPKYVLKSIIEMAQSVLWIKFSEHLENKTSIMSNTLCDKQCLFNLPILSHIICKLANAIFICN